MNYQEAIGKLLYIKRGHIPDWGNKQDEYYSMHEAINTAISAMQELQELHDQGLSMERLKDINFRKSVVEHINYDAYMRLMDELEEYKQLGTLEEVREAVEKQNEKTPTYDGDGYSPDGTFVWDEWYCPRCGTRYEVDYDDHDYCPNCGQHIDWSEEE